MRALYLETFRMLLNTVVCILIFGAGLELNSSYLQIIAVVMYLSHLIASIETAANNAVITRILLNFILIF